MASPTKKKVGRGPPAGPQGATTATGPGKATTVQTMQATAYGPPWDAMNGTGVTAQGTDLTSGKPQYIIAIPPGSPLQMGKKYFVHPNPVGCTGTCQFLVDDVCPGCTQNQIDIYDWKGRTSQYAWGKRTVKVTAGVGTPGGVQPTTMAGAVGKAGISAPDWLQYLARLFEPAFWLRVGKGVLGFALILYGTQALSKALLGIDLAGPSQALADALRKAPGKASGGSRLSEEELGSRAAIQQEAREVAKLKGQQARRTDFFKNVNKTEPPFK